MSVSNAISGIIILGAFTTLENAYSTSSIIISFLAIICASINIFGGFALSLRMLNFLKPQKKKEQTHE
jgi:NAD(P) transhydrogenase subunit alpha